MAKVLVDTSAWVEFLRRSDTPASRTVRSLLEQNIVCTTGVVLAELLCGSRNQEEGTFLITRLQSLEFLETTYEVWVHAGRMAAELRRQGLTLPLSDVILAAVAHLHGYSIYTTDAHFARIPHLNLYRP